MIFRDFKGGSVIRPVFLFGFSFFMSIEDMPELTKVAF